MTPTKDTESLSFDEAAQGLLKGDFSRLEPLFKDRPSPGGQCRVMEWYEQGCFGSEPLALAEAFTCACFLGRTKVVEFFLAQGLDPSGGARTGLNAFHWAANRGNLDTVKLLIRQQTPLEIESMYGGTVLGTAVWSAVNEPRPDHISIIEALISAGARLDAADYPSGDERLDELLRRYGAGTTIADGQG